MHLVIPINDVDNNNIFFLDKTKNNILNGGDFYRVLYSTKNVTLNGIFLSVKFKITSYENYFNKIKCHLEPNKNSESIERIKKLENWLLSDYFELNKYENDLQISQQLDSHNIKLINEYEDYNISSKTNEINVVLKISGIWTNGNKCGLTFRFFLTHQ
jgi:hypothetical protein